jgi:hypothetical protein
LPSQIDLLQFFLLVLLLFSPSLQFEINFFDKVRKKIKDNFYVLGDVFHILLFIGCDKNNTKNKPICFFSIIKLLILLLWHGKPQYSARRRAGFI